MVLYRWRSLEATVKIRLKTRSMQYWRHRRWGFTPWVGKIPGGGHGNPLQYFGLENPMDRGAQQATVHGVTKSQKWWAINTFTSLGTHVTRIYVYRLTFLFCFGPKCDDAIHVSWNFFQFVYCEHFFLVFFFFFFFFFPIFKSRSVMSDSLRPHELYSPWNSSGHNTGVGSHFLLQAIFPTQGSNPGLLHCRWILYHLN